MMQYDKKRKLNFNSAQTNILQQLNIVFFI